MNRDLILINEMIIEDLNNKPLSYFLLEETSDVVTVSDPNTKGVFSEFKTILSNFLAKIKSLSVATYNAFKNPKVYKTILGILGTIALIVIDIKINDYKNKRAKERESTEAWEKLQRKQDELNELLNDVVSRATEGREMIKKEQDFLHQLRSDMDAVINNRISS